MPVGPGPATGTENACGAAGASAMRQPPSMMSANPISANGFMPRSFSPPMSRQSLRWDLQSWFSISAEGPPNFRQNPQSFPRFYLESGPALPYDLFHGPLATPNATRRIMRFQVILLMSVSFLVAADSNEAVEKEFQRLEGKWQFVSIVSEGKDVPEEIVKAARLTISGKRFTLRMNTETHKGIINLNPDVYPKTINVTYNSGPEQGKKALGIYELHGDTLKVCMGVIGAKRPTKFVSESQSGHVLEVLKREKP
jgi:uncharacterized protein (TIGR03067 family)